MPKVSISYRRADSEAMTGRIFDRLASHYGKEAIFRDIDNIPPGIDFRVHINDMLRKTSVLLSVIGSNWVGAQAGGVERIHQESDAVRVEIETALRRRTPLIPVLIGNATMPSSDQLPPSLKDFSFRNALRVDTGADFDYHMDRLIKAIDTILGQAPASAPSGETRLPPGGAKSNTGSRQTVSEAADKKNTGSRAAGFISTVTGQTGEKERVSISVPIPKISSGVLWPADRQGQMLRLGLAGAAAVVLLLAVYGIFFRGGGDQDRSLLLTGHAGPVSSVAFSPNAKVLASGSSDKTVRIWDPGNGLLLHALTEDSEAVNAIAFEPNGKRLVSGGRDGVIAIRDTDTGQRMVRALRPEMSYNFGQALPAVLSVAVSPDGTQLVSGSADTTIKIWNADSGGLIRTLNGHSDAVTSVVYSPDGRTIYSGSADGTVRTWDSQSGQPLRTLRSHTGAILSVAVSPNGNRVAAAGSGDGVVIWEATTFQLLRTLSTQLSAVNALAFARDNRRLAVGGSDTSIQMWDAEAGQLVRSLSGHSGSIRSLAFSSDGRRLASGSDDRSVGIWPAN